MGPVESPHRHQTIEDWILSMDVCPIGSLFFADANHVPPEDVIVGKAFQGVVVPTTLLETLGPRHDNTMAHSLRDLDPPGQQHQRADVKVGRTT